MTAKPTTPENPYLAARREWNERYGDYVASARRWRFVGLFATAIAAIAVLGVVFIGAQSKFVPYVVEVDQLGQARPAQRADRAGPADPRVIKAMLAGFIGEWRAVGVDVQVQRRSIDRLYTMLAPNDPATNAVTEYYATGGNPFERATSETVTTDVTAILPVSDKTWQIEWRETRRNRQGQVIDTTRWKAAATVSIRPPKSETEILRNPIGLFISDLQWSQQLN